MPSMQLSNHENVNSKKLQSVEAVPRTGLLTRYLDNVKSMNTLTAGQYKSELNSFIKFVCDIEISPRKFSLKVRLPKSVRKEKEPLNKEDIVTILNACSNVRLKTYVMLLAAQGALPLVGGANHQILDTSELSHVNLSFDSITLQINPEPKDKNNERVV